MSIDKEAENIRKKLDEETSATVSVALFGQPGAGKSSLINKLIGEKVNLVPCKTEEFPRPAKRPKSSVLINTKLKLLRSYKESLKDYLDKKNNY